MNDRSEKKSFDSCCWNHHIEEMMQLCYFHQKWFVYFCFCIILPQMYNGGYGDNNTNLILQNFLSQQNGNINIKEMITSGVHKSLPVHKTPMHLFWNSKNEHPLSVSDKWVGGLISKGKAKEKDIKANPVWSLMAPWWIHSISLRRLRGSWTAPKSTRYDYIPWMNEAIGIWFDLLVFFKLYLWLTGGVRKIMNRQIDV